MARFKKKRKKQTKEEVFRVRLPRGKEVLGILEQRLGGNRMTIKCLDGKSRICRVPGRLRRRLWLREGNVVLVEPWELGGEEKGDIIWKYHPAEVDWLRRKGFLKTLEEEF
ncbi:MAG: translation initiation factor eIF-1A [Candidatus Pacearchaeota archaeon]|nr:MAG: translation initiation factor eIF-1A [Candidatus Pacearchaeota archaeon]